MRTIWYSKGDHFEPEECFKKGRYRTTAYTHVLPHVSTGNSDQEKIPHVDTDDCGGYKTGLLKQDLKAMDWASLPRPLHPFNKYHTTQYSRTGGDKN